MIKRGDVIFALAIAILILLMVLLLIPVDSAVIIQVGIASGALLIVFAVVSQFSVPRHRPAEESPQIQTIKDLILHAEHHLDVDIQKSVEAYKKIKHHYSQLEGDDKSKVLHDIMRLYLKLLENLHIKH